MKKLLAIVVLGLLFGENANAKNRPTLECVFNDADKTTTIFDLNKYGDEDFWIEDENGSVVPINGCTEITNFMNKVDNTIKINTIPRAIAYSKFPILVSSEIAVVITLVKWLMLPPTIITAPTSDIALPKAERRAVITRK